jgi:hypothetical protein
LSAEEVPLLDWAKARSGRAARVKRRASIVSVLSLGEWLCVVVLWTRTRCMGDQRWTNKQGHRDASKGGR